jgi:plasmid stability protein
MTNLTISLDEEVIREARVRAIREGTSVSAKVREFLQQYASEQPAASREQQKEAAKKILEMASSHAGGLGGWQFNRDELHDRPYRGSSSPSSSGSSASAPAAS